MRRRRQVSEEIDRESPIISRSDADDDPVVRIRMCTLSSLIYSSLFIPLPFLPPVSPHLDIEICSSSFHIQDVPLGQCLHHFGFLSLSVPERLFFQLRPSTSLADLFSRGFAKKTKKERGKFPLTFLACFNQIL